MSAARPVPARVALITGGSRGIGLAMARAFAREGYAVVISGREAKRLKAAARELEKTSKADITALPCDVRDPAAVERLLAEVRRQHPAINVLVNNAGVAHALATVEKLPVEIWKQVIDTNLTGTFLVTRAALPLMRAGSIIVNNLSVAAVNVFEGMGAYNASKAGALGFTNVLRQELRQRGIRVLALLAGATDTEIWEQFWPEAPKEKMVSPETVAQAVLFAVNAPANAAVEEIKIGPAAGAL
jgi:NAD(P)-dependent dehydrogenase (short-subunit alcohol dehydrogenase family)